MNIISLQARYIDAANQFLEMTIVYAENQGNNNQQTTVATVPINTTVAPWPSIISDVLAGVYGPITPYSIPTPKSVSSRQFRLALYNANKLILFDTAINSVTPQSEKDKVLIEWEYSSSFARSTQWLIDAATASGMNSADLDALFIAASSL